MYDTTLAYWYNLSIDTAQSNELAFIGYLVGYPWPSAPGGTFTTGAFQFGSSAAFPVTDASHGFGSAASFPDGTGGLLTSVYPNGSQLIPATNYALMLKAIAYLKWNGLTYKSIDYVTSLFWANYTFTIPYSTFDIEITLTAIGAVHATPALTWQLNTIFAIFTTDPQIVVVYV